MHYLITGGLGYVGSWLTHTLVKAGHTVSVLSRGTNAPDLGVPYTLLTADITNEAELRTTLAPHQFDCCIHAASFNEASTPDYARKALQVNGYGTHVVASVLADQPNLQSFIYLSTYHVYGRNEGIVSEITFPEPQSDYALTHLFGEEYVWRCHRLKRLPATVIRLSNGYGRPRTSEFTKWYLLINDLCRMAMAEKKLELRSSPEIKRDFVWLGDVANILEKIAQAPQCIGETYNLATGHAQSLGHIAATIGTAYEKRYGETLPISFGDTPPPSAELTVMNGKLLSALDGYEFSDHLEQEIDAILTRLESTKEA